MKIYQDNQGAIALAKNPIFHQRTKHIDIKYHFVREKVESDEFELGYVPTVVMQPDFLTKNLPNQILRSMLTLLVLQVIAKGMC